MGVLSALPLVGAANLCCCLWVVTGGVVAAYLLQQNQSTPITPGDGALVGLLAGLVGAVATSVLAIPISLLMAPVQQAISERILQMPGEMPPWIRNAIEASSRQGVSLALQVAFWFLSLLLYLVLGGIFSTVGGVLGALIFKKAPMPPVPPPVDQPPTFGV
jgi:ABC-type branched-subunit amino acid transport system permease subunit